MELDHVGMPEPPDRPGLAQPAPAILRVDRMTRPDDLDGHTASQVRLPGLVDDPHGTSPELAFDHETGDGGRMFRLCRT
jgi:hypothetical protein